MKLSASTSDVTFETPLGVDLRVDETAHFVTAAGTGAGSRAKIQVYRNDLSVNTSFHAIPNFSDDEVAVKVARLRVPGEDREFVSATISCKDGSDGTRNELTVMMSVTDARDLAMALADAVARSA